MQDDRFQVLKHYSVVHTLRGALGRINLVTTKANYVAARNGVIFFQKVVRFFVPDEEGGAEY